MPRPENANRPEPERTNSQSRTTALIGLGIAATVGVFAWYGLNHAADAGIARLARIDKARAVCDSGWSTARDQRDSMRIDLISLPDTIDAGSSGELSRCANLRPNGMPTARATNPRDMTAPPQTERRP